MALPAKKYYKGAAANAVLTSNPSSGDATMTVDTVTGWPVSFPFFAVIDAGTSKEEKVKVTAISTLTLTVVRAQDDTSAVAHSAGAAIYPVFTALEASEANEVASIMTAKGDLITNDGSNINRLAVGATNTHVLQVDSTAANGIKWGQVATNGIADGAVTVDKLGTGAVTSAKILDGTIVAGDLAASLLKLVCPVGTIVAYPGASAPTGWLLCNGTSTSGYSELAALVGATTPDLQGRVPMGKTATGTGSELKGTGGSRKIASNHLPTHTHSLSNHTHSGTTSETATSSSIRVVGTAGTSFLASHIVGYAPGANVDLVNTSQFPQHSHTFTTGGPSTDTTSNGGFANDDYFQPFVAVNYIIKHDYV